MKRIVLFLLMIMMGTMFVGTASAAQEVCPSDGGWTKFEAGYGSSVDYTAPEGQLVAETCVKASTVVDYDLYVPAVASVTINSPSTNNNGQVQDISHYSIRLVPAPVVVPVQPEDEVEMVFGEETLSCDSGTAHQVVTETTTPYILVDNVWVLGESIVVVREHSRPLTEEETAACPNEKDPVVEPVIEQTPVETPIQTPAEAPVQVPAETQVETPVQTPVQTEAPVEVEAPVVTEESKATTEEPMNHDVPMPVYNGVYAAPNSYEAPLDFDTTGYQHNNDNIMYGGLAVLVTIAAGIVFWIAIGRRLTQRD